MHLHSDNFTFSLNLVDSSGADRVMEPHYGPACNGHRRWPADGTQAQLAEALDSDPR